MEHFSKISKAVVTPFMIALLCTFLFFFLYRYDNKYTYPGIQPINGVLCLSEQDLTQHKTYFLTRGWEFYPGRLLTPEDFDQKSPDSYMRFITIGEYNDFNMEYADRSPVGSATYRLFLSLPKSLRVYSLMVPEVFSSYRLYINGVLNATMGNPDPNHYQTKIGKQLVTFSANGPVEIILATTNLSHFYSGLTYPPLFGVPQAVTRMLDIQLLIKGIAIALTFLIAIFSFYIYLRIDKNSAKLFSFLCFCMIGYTCYPILFSLLSLNSLYWYTFELLCTYGIYFFVVVLQNHITQNNRTQVRIICTFLCWFYLFIVLYTLVLSNTPMIHILFSAFTGILKFAIAVYLIWTSVLAVLYQKANAPSLLVSTICFGLSLIADRLFPLYEPIYGGWFPEYGAAFLIIGLGFALSKNLIDSYRFRLIFEEEKRQLTTQVAIQKSHYVTLTQKIEDSNRQRHDQRHMLRTLSSFLNWGELDKALEYLASYRVMTDSTPPTILCDNLIIDAILQYYQGLCDQKNITFEVLLDIPPEVPLPDTDFTILLGNLVENAFEACCRQTIPNPSIKILGKYKQNKLLLRIENSFDTPLKMKDGVYLSATHPGQGIGIQSVKALVEHYHGLFDLETSGHLFRISIIIRFPSEPTPPPQATGHRI